MDVDRAFTVEDLRRAAQRRVPRMIYDLFEGGAEDELTATRNRAAFRAVVLEPRYLVDVRERSLETTILGRVARTPIMLAPTGINRMVHPDGELAVATAAGAVGAVSVFSVFSSATLEEIAEAATGPRWFQIYLWRDRDVTANLVERACAAGYDALCLTVDTPVIGHRERDLRNGLTLPPRLTWRNALDVARRPGWLYRFARTPEVTFASMRGVAGAEGDDGVPLIQYVNRELFDAGQTWDDLRWLREIWDGPLAVKGITHPADAKRAVAEGADAIVVSNHGGRQLDGGPATIEALPRVVEAVGGSAEVIVDGGIRRGGDVVKALALGATACMVGRPYWYGLGAGGERGVRRVLEVLNAETDRTLALVGRTSPADVDRSLVRVPPAWLDPCPTTVESAGRDHGAG